MLELVEKWREELELSLKLLIIEPLEFISDLLNIEFIFTQTFNIDVCSILLATFPSSIVRPNLLNLNGDINFDSSGAKAHNQFIAFSYIELI